MRARVYVCVFVCVCVCVYLRARACVTDVSNGTDKKNKKPHDRTLCVVDRRPYLSTGRSK